MRYLGSQIANVYETKGEAAATAMIADVTREGRFRVWLYTIDGDFVAGPSRLADADAVLSAGARDDAERTVGAESLLARAATSASGARYVIIWEAPRWLRTQFSPLRLSMRLVALILTGGAVCALLTWQITKPIRTLRHAARRFADGDLTTRVSTAPELRRGDELTELARDFDHMAARIEEFVTSQQQLLADISHELRSPLARLSLALDLARRRLGDDVPEHQRIEREIQRLNALIEQLLTLAGLQRQSDPLGRETVNMRELVHDIAQDARFEAEAAQRTLVVERECDASMRGNRALLRSGIENVVRNAIRHTAEGTTVRIAMEPQNGAERLAITVRDHGPGAPAAALHRLFDPFYRVDEARDRSSGGIGLGLAITRQAMLAHGGNASAENHPDGGLLVTLELPLIGRPHS
jgi:two-component system sensor histidine kinase CpxA